MVDMDSGNQQLLDKLLAVEQDLDGKLKGVNDHSTNLVEKINSLDTENRDNAQKIVTIQESLVLQSQNINKVESERQTSEANAKKELEATVDKNAKAISDLKAEMEKAIQNVGENLGKIEPRVKTNEDHNKQIDDALDAINSSISGLGGKQLDLTENLNQVNIAVNKTQVLEESSQI